MFSIIVCSISSERLEALKSNLQQTIGLNYEIIAIDNTQKKWSIAKVYNYGASKAQYPYLFFVHEDVKFHSSDWGKVVAQKLLEPNCGVIGFAGSKIRIDCYAGWCQADEYVVSYLYQKLHNGLTELRIIHAYMERSFEEVITLDGLGLFVRKEVWEKNPFDEELLTGFHCYDIDFSMQVASLGLKNYVCCSSDVLIEHFSLGNFDEKWFIGTIRCHHKWKRLLPMQTDDVVLSDKHRLRYEECFSYDFMKKMFKTSNPRADKWIVLKNYWKRSHSWKHFKRCVSYTIKYFVTLER